MKILRILYRILLMKNLFYKQNHYKNKNKNNLNNKILKLNIFIDIK